MNKNKIALGFRPSLPEIKALSYKMTFGKYKGMSVEEILEIDANYILWLSDEKITKVSEEILQYAEEADLDQRLDATTGWDVENSGYMLPPWHGDVGDED